MKTLRGRCAVGLWLVACGPSVATPEGASTGDASSAGDTAPPTTTDAGNDGTSVGVSTSTGTPDGSSSSADTTDAGTTGVPIDPCAEYVGLATPDELDVTPRRDEGAEILALELSGELVAPDAIYDRIAHDLATIRAEVPELAQVPVVPAMLHQTLTIGLTDEAAQAAREGDYDAWACPNALYRVVETSILDQVPWAVLQFDGRYDIEQLIPEYTVLEGVTNAYAEEPSKEQYDGDVCLVSSEDLTYRYVFRDGACLVPPCDLTYWGFVTDAAGTLETLGSFTTADPVPAWYADIDCPA